MPSDREQLIDMGFEPDRVDWALKATKNSGLQPAMDHLLAHSEEPVPDPSAAPPPAGGRGDGSANAPMDLDEDDEDTEALRAALGKASANIAPSSGAGEGSGSGEDGAEAKSIKCMECNKIFKNTALANYHAEKSGHDQFEESTEEIKPLTEEEKKAKLEELRLKMAEKRALKAKAEAEEAKANEAIRRKGGKDIGVLKEDLKKKEAVKMAEQARRDKAEDAKARAAIKAQIEADKRERAERTAREKAVRDGTALPAAAASTSTATATPAAATTGVPSSEYKETRLQIRLSAGGGKPIVVTLPSDKTLRDVAEHVASESLAVDVETVSFSTQFPRKQYARSDFSKTLKELGLTPSAVLIAS